MDNKTIEGAFPTRKKRLSPKMEQVLNDQIEGELTSSQIYLGLAAWADVAGYTGIAKYFFAHVDEERKHMMKHYSYMLGKNIMPKTPAVPICTMTCKDLKDALTKALDREMEVTCRYETALPIALTEKDQMTYEFLQWFIHEQHEEEENYLTWLDRIEVAGGDKRAMFLVDQEILQSM
jgi:ferritin